MPNRSTALDGSESSGGFRFAIDGLRRTGGGVGEGEGAITSRIGERGFG
jgi:hypothetical protein